MSGWPSRIRGGDSVTTERGSLFSTLYEGAFPFAALSDYDVRVALHQAHGVLDDHGLLNEFAAAAEEAIVEAHGQTREP